MKPASHFHGQLYRGMTEPGMTEVLRLTGKASGTVNDCLRERSGNWLATAKHPSSRQNRMNFQLNRAVRH
jgi:hypothetical protein